MLFSQSNFEKGEQLYNEEKYSQAQVFFQSYLKQNPADIKTLEFLGSTAGHTKNWEQAVFCYKKLKTAKPNEANYHFKYGATLGMQLTKMNKLKALVYVNEVRTSFETAILLNSKHIEARWGLVYYYLNLPRIFGGSEEKAVKYSNELMKLSPVDGYLSKGKIEEYFERYDFAEDYYKKAIAAGSSKTGVRLLENLKKINRQ